jgi:hypothetical protein
MNWALIIGFRDIYGGLYPFTNQGLFGIKRISILSMWTLLLMMTILGFRYEKELDQVDRYTMKKSANCLKSRLIQLLDTTLCSIESRQKCSRH